MSSVDFRSEINVTLPLSEGDVRRLVRAILENGWSVGFTKHAKEELANDDMSTVDATNVLRCWRYMDPAEQDIKTGEWKYRVHTELMGVVVKFRSERHVTVITAWRK